MDAPAQPAVWPRVCRCCERTHTEAQWNSLTKRGYVGAWRAGGRLYAVELRDCDCRTTLGVEVELDAPERPVAACL
jgi:hypothetical protein